MSGNVTSQQLTGLINGLDPMLDSLEQTVASKVVTQALPILGSALSTVFNNPSDPGQAALLAFQTLVTDIKQGLANLAASQAATFDQGIGGGPFVNTTSGITTTAIQNAINNAIGSAGFGSFAQVGLSGGVLSVTLDPTNTVHFSPAIAGSYGLPNLPLNVTGHVTADMGYTLDVVASVNLAGNFSVIEPLGNALTASLNVSAPALDASASFGLLHMSAADAGSHLNGQFAVNLAGNATFTGNAALDVKLNTNLGNPGLPSFSTELQAGWGFNASVLGGNISAFGNTPTLAFNNTNLDFGSFIDDYIRPILDTIKPVLLPLSEALAVFNTNLDFLKVVPGLSAALDVAGGADGSGNDIPDGHITLIDFLKLAANVAGQSSNFVPLENIASFVDKMVHFAAALDQVTLGPDNYSLGSFLIGSDIRVPGFSIGAITPTVTSQAASLGSFLANLPAAYGVTPPNSTETIGQMASDLLTSANVVVPLLSNPAATITHLLGNTPADLFDLNIPDFTVHGFGAIAPDGTPTSVLNLLDFTPIPTLPELHVLLGGALQAAFGINIGMDTTGLIQYAQGGFTDPSKIIDGLYVENPTNNGTSQPIASVSAALQLDLELSALVASVAGGGNVSGTLSLYLADGGKNYINTLASTLQSAPLSAFVASGIVTAGLDAAVKVFGQTITNYHSARVTLLTFNDGAPDAANALPPIPPTNTWIGPVSGDFSNQANWSPAYVNATLSGKPLTLYGDVIIHSGVAVTFGTVPSADIYTLQLAAGSVLDLQQNSFFIDGGTSDTDVSNNAGLVRVDGAANLVLNDSVNNTGTILMGAAAGPNNETTPLITIGGQLVKLYGGGSVVMVAGESNLWAGSAKLGSPGKFPVLWNVDNTISGSGVIGRYLASDPTQLNSAASGFDLINSGTIAGTDSGTALQLVADTTNTGLLEAIGAGGTGAPPVVGGLYIETNVDNHSGTIAATNNGAVTLSGPVTITGGTLFTTPGNNNNQITNFGTAVLAGGTDGITIDAVVIPGAASTIRLTGLIIGESYRDLLGPTPSTARILSGQGTVLLDGATVTGGELRANTPTGLQVASPSTLDGAANPGAIGLDGVLLVGANTLTLVGEVDAGVADSGTIELAGGLLKIGRLSAASAFLAPGGVASAPGAPHGVVQLDDGQANVITGVSAGALLTNTWTIRGSGQLGQGQLSLTNNAAGTIAGTGAGLVVDTGANVILNHGLMEALGGTLQLRGVINSSGGGQIAAMHSGNLAGIVILDGADLIGGGISGDAADGNSTLLLSALGATLDGGAHAVSLAATGKVAVSAGQTLTLDGAIANSGTISVGGNGSAGTAGVVLLAGTVTLTGGGTVRLAETANISGNANTQVVTGSSASDGLDNVDNTIRGYGLLGNGALTLVNESGGTIDADGYTLQLDTGAAVITDNGVLESTGGLLDIRSDVDAHNGGRILVLDGNSNIGTVLLDGVALHGGTISTDAVDKRAALGVTGAGGTLDGTANAVTLTAGGRLPSPPGGR